MGLFKTRVDENWKINYIKEFNEMRSEYEKKILSKQNEIDDLKKQLEELKCFRSNLSPPIILSLSMQEAQLLEEHIDRFTRIGFEIEHFGGEEYAVRAVPDNLFGIAKKELLMEMIDDLADGINTSMTPDLIDEKVASMSCKAAVKGNNRLSAKEVDALIGELLTLDNPYHCPHGRPTIIAMTKRELEKKFKRIV